MDGRRFGRLGVAALVLGSFAGALAFAPGGMPDGMDVEKWREDLRFLASELPAKHLNLFHHLPREEWDAQVAELDARIGELDDVEVAAEFQRLIVLVGDAHTTVQYGSAPFAGKGAPIELHWFPDGVRLVGAPIEHADAVGGKLVKIGGVAFDEAWRRAVELISHENEASLRAYVPDWLANPGFLRAAGLAQADAIAHYTFEPDGAAGGRTIDVDLRARTTENRFAYAQPKEPPLWLKHRWDSAYWFEYLPESKTLFLQYNRCADDPKKPFAQLAEELFAVVDREKPEKLVVDLRHNSGGNSAVIAPLYAGFGSRRDLRSRGHLFVAIGPRTFSSGMMNAAELRDGWGAILVGEPTGGKPHTYGEVRILELPNSKIRVGYCTKLFARSKKDTPSLEPDVAAPLAFEDWRTGRDPVLEAVAHWKDERADASGR